MHLSSAHPVADVVFNTNCGRNSAGNPGCTLDGAGATQRCSCTGAVDYGPANWSSNTYFEPFYAYGVQFAIGDVQRKMKSEHHLVRAVRSAVLPGCALGVPACTLPSR